MACKLIAIPFDRTSRFAPLLLSYPCTRSRINYSAGGNQENFVFAPRELTVDCCSSLLTRHRLAALGEREGNASTLDIGETEGRLLSRGTESFTSFTPRHLAMDGVDPRNFSLNLSERRVARGPSLAPTPSILLTRGGLRCTCTNLSPTPGCLAQWPASCVDNVHAHTGRHVALAGARRPSSPVPPVCAKVSPLGKFQFPTTKSPDGRTTPNDVPDRYFVSRINKAATLRDLFALPSAFHRLCIAASLRARLLGRRSVLFTLPVRTFFLPSLHATRPRTAFVDSLVIADRTRNLSAR